MNQSGDGEKDYFPVVIVTITITPDSTSHVRYYRMLIPGWAEEVKLRTPKAQIYKSGYTDCCFSQFYMQINR